VIVTVLDGPGNPIIFRHLDGGIRSFPAGSNKAPDTLIEAKYGYQTQCVILLQTKC